MTTFFLRYAAGVDNINEWAEVNSVFVTIGSTLDYNTRITLMNGVSTMGRQLMVDIPEEHELIFKLRFGDYITGQQ